MACSRNMSVSSPHVLRKSLTTASTLTACVISSIASEQVLSYVDELELAPCSNSLVKASFSAAPSARLGAVLGPLLELVREACAMAASLCAEQPVSRVDKVSDSENAPLGQVHLSTLVRVELGGVLSSLLGTMRSARFGFAGDQELLDLVLGLDGVQNLLLRQRAQVVLAIMMKTSRARSSPLNSSSAAAARARALALVGELREALLEAAVDRLLPCVRKSRGGCK